MTFKIGQKVKWSSQSNGRNKEKHGEIIDIIQAHQWPLDIIKKHEDTGLYVSKYGGGLTRSYISYVVAVDGKTDKSKKQLYWPSTFKLKPVQP